MKLPPIVKGQGRGSILPNLEALHLPYLVATGAGQLTIKEGTYIKLLNQGAQRFFGWDSDFAFSVAGRLDTGTMQPGRDYYVYLCWDGLIWVSANSTYPNGYDANTSRKIGGFHTLCANVGTISGHMLSGLTAGSILPNSVWCLNFRPTCSPEGMVYCGAIDGCWVQPPSGVPQMSRWVDIYLQSGTGASTASVYGGTITDTRYWDRHVEDLGAVGKRLLFDHEFTIAAYGSNAKTNISGSSDPVTTGGHVDTAGRRMVSHWGCEDCCGAMWQWLLDSNFRYDVGSSPSVAAASQTATVYHTASPGGNRVYLKYGMDGQPYLCSNLAVLQNDKWVAFGSYAIQLKYDANASSGLAVYINKAATNAYERFLVNNAVTGKDAFCISSLPDYSLKVVHSTSASSYSALYFNDSAMRFEANMDGTNGTVDLCATALSWGYQDLGDNFGSMYRQSSSGQGIKLLAGGAWGNGPNCGPRCRNANSSRWYADSSLGGRGCAEPR